MPKAAALHAAVPDLTDRRRGPARTEAAAVPAAAIKSWSAPSISEFPAGPVAQLVSRVGATIARAAIPPVGEVRRLPIPREKSVPAPAMPERVFGMHRDPQLAFPL